MAPGNAKPAASRSDTNFNEHLFGNTTPQTLTEKKLRSASQISIRLRFRQLQIVPVAPETVDTNSQ